LPPDQFRRSPPSLPTKPNAERALPVPLKTAAISVSPPPDQAHPQFPHHYPSNILRYMCTLYKYVDLCALSSARSRSRFKSHCSNKNNAQKFNNKTEKKENYRMYGAIYKMSRHSGEQSSGRSLKLKTRILQQSEFCILLCVKHLNISYLISYYHT